MKEEGDVVLRVLIIGGASWDTIIQMDEFPKGLPQTLFAKESYSTAGSTGIGKALALKKLGFDVVFHAVIGEDHEGLKIIELMEREGIRFLVDYSPNGTEKHTNLMNSKGERISIYTNTLPNQMNLNFKRLEEEVNQADIIVLNIISYTKALIPLLKYSKKEIWVDIHDYDGINPYHKDFIDIADVLFASSENLTQPMDFMTDQMESGKKLVILTSGKKGSSLLGVHTGFLREGIVENTVMVDTNGAGDNFFAGFLYAYSKEYPLQKCLRMGSIVAASSVESRDIVFSELSDSWLENRFIELF